MVGLAYAIVQGPLSNIGWMHAAKRELELSEMLRTDGAEGEARKGLRSRAVKRVLASIDRAESLSSSSVRVTQALSVLSLAFLGVTCLLNIVFLWMGGTPDWLVAMYFVAIVFPAVSTLAYRAAIRLRKRRLAFRRRIDDYASQNDKVHEAEQTEAEKKPDHESADEKL